MLFPVALQDEMLFFVYIQINCEAFHKFQLISWCVRLSSDHSSACSWWIKGICIKFDSEITLVWKKELRKFKNFSHYKNSPLTQYPRRISIKFPSLLCAIYYCLFCLTTSDSTSVKLTVLKWLRKFTRWLFQAKKK